MLAGRVRFRGQNAFKDFLELGLWAASHSHCDFHDRGVPRPRLMKVKQTLPAQRFAGNAVVERINVLIEQHCTLTIRQFSLTQVSIITTNKIAASA